MEISFTFVIGILDNVWETFLKLQDFEGTSSIIISILTISLCLCFSLSRLSSNRVMRKIKSLLSFPRSFCKLRVDAFTTNREPFCHLRVLCCSNFHDCYLQTEKEEIHFIRQRKNGTTFTAWRIRRERARMEVDMNTSRNNSIYRGNGNGGMEIISDIERDHERQLKLK